MTTCGFLWWLVFLFDFEQEKERAGFYDHRYVPRNKQYWKAIQPFYLSFGFSVTLLYGSCYRWSDPSPRYFGKNVGHDIYACVWYLLSVVKEVLDLISKDLVLFKGFNCSLYQK